MLVGTEKSHVVNCFEDYEGHPIILTFPYSFSWFSFDEKNNKITFKSTLAKDVGNYTLKAIINDG
jgi:hypothetical protein